MQISNVAKAALIATVAPSLAKGASIPCSWETKDMMVGNSTMYQVSACHSDSLNQLTNTLQSSCNMTRMSAPKNTNWTSVYGSDWVRIKSSGHGNETSPELTCMLGAAQKDTDRGNKVLKLGLGIGLGVGLPVACLIGCIKGRLSR